MKNIAIAPHELKQKIEEFRIFNSPSQEMDESASEFSSRETTFESTIDNILSIIDKIEEDELNKSLIIAKETVTLEGFEFVKGERYFVSDQDKWNVYVEDELENTYCLSYEEMDRYFKIGNDND